MIEGLLVALRKAGASEGKPFFVTQALGIPWVATVFLFLRLLLLMDVGDVNFFDAFDQFRLLDLLLLCACVWMYTGDFFRDVIHWDVRSFPMRTWQVLWVLFWGLLPFLGLFLLASLRLFSLPNWYRLGISTLQSLQFSIIGGICYLWVHRLNGRWAAMLGPFFIAFTFDCALFWDNPDFLYSGRWWQGLMVFWLNVVVMQWFEQDKDAASGSKNIWLQLSAVWLRVLCLVLVLVSIAFWVVLPQISWGFPLLLTIYATMVLWPRIFRWGRLYRLVIDGGLVLWLL